MVRPKILVSTEEKILKKLDEYAKKEFMGNRSMAIHHILTRFFAEKEN